MTINTSSDAAVSPQWFTFNGNWLVVGSVRYNLARVRRYEDERDCVVLDFGDGLYHLYPTTNPNTRKAVELLMEQLDAYFSTNDL